MFSLSELLSRMTNAESRLRRFGTANKSARDDWLEKTLSKIPAGQSILDAGAGELQNKRLCSHLDYVSQDLAAYQGHTRGSGLHRGTAWDTSRIDVMSNVLALPFRDASFDAVLCSEVLEHVPDPTQALRELARVLRAEGTMVVTAPFNSITHQAPFHFHSGFSRYFFSHWAEVLGLKIVDLDSNGDYFSYIAQELTRLHYVLSRYSGINPNLLHRLAILIVRSLLYRGSKSDNGSDELLCFGFHFHATKVAR